MYHRFNSSFGRQSSAPDARFFMVAQMTDCLEAIV